MKCQEIVKILRIEGQRFISVRALVEGVYSDRWRLEGHKLYDWDNRIVKVDDPENLDREY